MSRRPAERVAVTGAAGFIGSNLVDALLARGYHVLGVDRLSPAGNPVAASNLQHALAHDDFTLSVRDLAVDSLRGVVAGCDTVYHLAAVPGVRSSWGASFHDYLAANVLATQRLLDACEAEGVRRLVFASSSSVYGETLRPSRETDVASPLSPYGVTKLAAEQLCMAHAKRPGATLTAIGLRYFSVYGPRQRPDMAIRRILNSALSGTSFDLYGDGTQRREFTYVSDVVNATMAAASLDARHEVINVGGGSSTRLIDVLSVLKAITGLAISVKVGAGEAGDVRNTSADLTVARSLLNYRPKIGLREGVSAEWQWLTSMGTAAVNGFGIGQEEPVGVLQNAAARS